MTTSPDTIDHYPYRRIELYIDSCQHDLLMLDLHQLAAWIEQHGRRLPGVDHDPVTIAARLRDLHDSMTAYEER